MGVTGLARAGKTAFLTSTAANLLALGAGRASLPLLSQRLRGRSARISLAPAEASALPRFGHREHLAALAQEPPAWPARTNAASLLALDVTLGREGLAQALPDQRIRLEFLDYPGEWLLDLPLLRTTYAAWSAATLTRLEGREQAREFLAFQAGLPRGAGADDQLALAGHRLYCAALRRLRDEAGLSFLQPGRFLMPAPGPAPGWMPFFPYRGGGGLGGLLGRRYEAYTQAVQRDLSDPLFGNLDRLVVLVDLLSALHDGPDAFADAQAALAAAAAALRWRRGLLEAAYSLARLEGLPRSIGHVVFAATKADHIGERQRHNLAGLLRDVAAPSGPARAAYFALAAVRCTEEEVIRIGDRAVSGVIGRRAGDERAMRSYPGEVPHTAPGAAFWGHRFLDLPDFEPLRPVDEGRGGVRHIGLDAVLSALLDDML